MGIKILLDGCTGGTVHLRKPSRCPGGASADGVADPLLRKGGDLVSLQATLGHANISTTGRYAKALMEGQQRLVNSFEMPESESNIIDLNEAVG